MVCVMRQQTRMHGFVFALSVHFYTNHFGFLMDVPPLVCFLKQINSI